MTIVRVAQEAAGLVISVEGSDGTPTTIVLGGTIPGPLAISGPAVSASVSPPARPRRSWLLGGLCFVLAIGLGIIVAGRDSAIGANDGASLASASAGPQVLAPATAYPVQGPSAGQLPPAIASALAQPPVVVPVQGEVAAPFGQASGAASAPAANPGALFGLQQ